MQTDRQRPLFVPDFIVIPYQLLTDGELETMDKHLYGILYWFERMKDGYCKASNQTLAALLITTTRVVQNSLNTLEKRGYITRDYKDEAKRNRLAIHCMVAFSNVSPIGDRLKTNDLQVTRERPVGDRRERPVGDQSSNTKIKNTDKKTRAESAGAEERPQMPVTQDSPIEQQIAEIIYRFKDYNPAYKTLFNRNPQRDAARRLLEQFKFDPLCAMVNYLRHSNAAKYAPTITTPSQLESKLGELKAWADKQRSGNGKGKKIIRATPTA